MASSSVLLEEEEDDDEQLRLGYLVLILLIVLVIFGNFLVLIAVLIDRKLRSITTNKFIASLAISDLLVGAVVMPLALYVKINDDKWGLGQKWCQFHLVTGVFSTTASIVHLVAISLDRYFAIMFPTEYQRHAVSTSALPYVIMIWVMSLAVSSTLFLERSLTTHAVCWIEDPQYLVLSSFLSFILPGAVVVFLYVKIFRKLRNHRLSMFGQPALLRRAQGASGGDQQRRSLPRVIIEEVRSRRGSRLSQGGHSHSDSGSPSRRSSATASQKSDRSPSQPDIHNVVVQPQRWRSPTICAETLEHDRNKAAKKRVSIVPDPPSMDFGSFNQCKVEVEMDNKNDLTSSPLLVLSQLQNDADMAEVVIGRCNGLEKALERKKLSPPSFLTVPLLTDNNTINTPPLSPAPQTNLLMVPDQPASLTVPRKWDCPSPSGSNPSSGHSSNSSYTSGSASTDADDYRRVSMHSYGSTMTDGTDSTLEMDSR
uniref:G-protein coupled receptors family 1 profile domain-containing protein n=1 Tax=Plectus sambesii TaxID=2011161 RepID=A0A914XMU0_9BILA